MESNDDVTYTCEFCDIPFWFRILLTCIVAVVVLSMAGCGSAAPVEKVKREPPVAAMVRLDPLQRQIDPSLGGMFKGYVNAAQQYRGCVDRLTELQEWVMVGELSQ